MGQLKLRVWHAGRYAEALRNARPYKSGRLIVVKVGKDVCHRCPAMTASAQSLKVDLNDSDCCYRTRMFAQLLSPSTCVRIAFVVIIGIGLIESIDWVWCTRSDRIRRDATRACSTGGLGATFDIDMLLALGCFTITGIAFQQPRLPFLEGIVLDRHRVQRCCRRRLQRWLQTGLCGSCRVRDSG